MQLCGKAPRGGARLAHHRPAGVLGAVLQHIAGHARSAPETELLVETVLNHAKAGPSPGPLRILDLGTGSGCILGALLTAAAPKRAASVSTDLKPRWRWPGIICRSWGCWIARHSYVLDWIGAIGGGRSTPSSATRPISRPRRFASCRSEVSSYDPTLALDGGEDGLEAYRIIVPQAFAALRDGGLLVFEIGYRQGGTVLDLMKQSAPRPGFSGVRIFSGFGRRRAGPLQECDSRERRCPILK